MVALITAGTIALGAGIAHLTSILKKKIALLWNVSMSYNGRLLFLLPEGKKQMGINLLCQCPTTDDYYFYIDVAMFGFKFHDVSMSYNGRLLFLLQT